MKTLYIYPIIAALMAMPVLSSCSDNNDPVLKPTVNDRTIILEAEGQTVSDNGIDLSISLDLDAASQEIPVKVTSNTLWEVKVDGNASWCTVDAAKGQGNGTFTITVLNNRSEERFCEISVHQIDGEGKEYPKGNNATIKIVQQGCEVYITPSSVDIFPAEEPKEKEFDIVANAHWTLSVSYENEAPDEYITIIPLNGMSESDTDDGKKVYTGDSNAAFKISLQDNRTPVVRKAHLDLKTENGNYSVEILQQKSEHPFNVSPNETRYVPAEGNTLNFDVYSPGEGWTVTADSWIICPDTKFEKNDRWVSISVTVLPNTNGKERPGKIYFKSDYAGYEAVPVEVVQSGYDLTFNMSSADGSRVVMEEGGSLSFDLDSRFDWTIETNSWISLSADHGNASISSRLIELKIGKNTTNDNRTGKVTIYPQPTVVEGGVTLDPKDLGIDSLEFYVTQFGGREPAISAPWLVDGYTQTTATIEFNYYSPFARIIEAGLQWRREDANDWNSIAFDVTNPTEGTVTVDLTSLDPATKHVARGYVKDENGKTWYGSVSYPFTTAGRYPTIEDNPTPSM